MMFHPVDNEQIICYSKATGDSNNVILVVVNLDPFHTQSGWVDLQIQQLGIDADRPYQVHDLLTGSRYMWNQWRNFVQLDPYSAPAHVFRIRRKARTEQDFDYFM